MPCPQIWVLKRNYTHAKKTKATLSFVLGSFNLHSNSGVTYSPTHCGWRPSHMSWQSVRMFDTILSPSKTMQVFLQYGKEHICKLVMPYHLTSLPGPKPSLIYRSWDNQDWWVLYMIVSLPSRHISRIGTLASWTIDNAFHNGWGGYNPRLLLSMHKRLKEWIHKGSGHTRYELQYITLLS